MAKSGRKRKKAEKSKTKLRQSIKLPKGLNETKAEVKSKTIVVLNQLKNKDGTEEERLTRKKIGVKDLLNKLNNNGLSTKLEGLEGLLELLKSFPEIAEENLSALISNVVPLHAHFETKIRNATRSLTTLILNEVDSDQIDPLASLITAHLCCGLSHIDSDIQLDSLKLLDIILESCPNVVKLEHEQILPNCLDQVALKSKSTDQMRSLNKNMNSKLTALQWRTEVLQRILQILSLIETNVEKNSNDIPLYGVRNYEENFHLALTHPQNSSLSLNEIRHFRNLDFAQEENDDNFSLKSFKNGLQNILFQTWCEAISIDTKKKDSFDLINSSVLPTLSIVIDLILSMDHGISDQFFNHVIKCFPLELLPPSREKKDKKVFEDSGKFCVHQLNLNICLLTLQTDSATAFQDLSGYISDFHIDNGAQASKVGDIISLIVEKDIKEIATVLENAISQISTKFRFNENVTKAMIRLSTWTERSKIPSIDSWVQALPEILVSSRANQNHVQAVQTLFKRRDSILMEAFNSNGNYPISSAKNSTISLDEVWKTLLLFPDTKVPRKEIIEISQKADISNFTRNFAMNVC